MRQFLGINTGRILESEHNAIISGHLQYQALIAEQFRRGLAKMAKGLQTYAFNLASQENRVAAIIMHLRSINESTPSHVPLPSLSYIIPGAHPCQCSKCSPHIKEAIKQEVRDEIRDEVSKEIRSEVETAFRAEIEAQVRQDLEGSLREELSGRIRRDLVQEVRADVAREIRSEVEAVAKADIERECEARLHNPLREQITTENARNAELMAAEAKATAMAADLIDDQWNQYFTAIGAFQPAYQNTIHRFAKSSSRSETSLPRHFEELPQEISVSSLESFLATLRVEEEYYQAPTYDVAPITKELETWHFETESQNEVARQQVFKSSILQPLDAQTITHLD